MMKKKAVTVVPISSDRKKMGRTQNRHGRRCHGGDIDGIDDIDDIDDIDAVLLEEEHAQRRRRWSSMGRTKDDNDNDRGQHQRQQRRLVLGSAVAAVAVSVVAVLTAGVAGGRQEGPATGATAPWGLPFWGSKTKTSSPSSEPQQQQQQPQQRRLHHGRWDDFDGVAKVSRNYEVLGVYGHDPDAFTQGLAVVVSDARRRGGRRNGQDEDDPSNENVKDDERLLLVETVGHYGRSELRVWDPFLYHAAATTTAEQGAQPPQGDNDNSNSVDVDVGVVPAPTAAQQQQHRRTKTTALNRRYFAEGVCQYSDPITGESRYIVLTWREGRVLIYNATTMSASMSTSTMSTMSKANSKGNSKAKDDDANDDTNDDTNDDANDDAANANANTDGPTLLRDIAMPSPTHTSQGWGIAHDPVEGVFYVSDGSHYLHVWDVSTLLEVRPKVPVTIQLVRDRDDGDGDVDGKHKRDVVPNLNEMEWDDETNTILANVWFQDVVIRIHPYTGHVLHVYDFSTLYVDRVATADVLNGIALTPRRRMMRGDGDSGTTTTTTTEREWWLTGKYWPHIYRLRVME